MDTVCDIGAVLFGLGLFGLFSVQEMLMVKLDPWGQLSAPLALTHVIDADPLGSEFSTPELPPAPQANSNISKVAICVVVQDEAAPAPLVGVSLHRGIFVALQLILLTPLTFVMLTSE